MAKARYMLGIVDRHGGKWLAARNPRQHDPIRTTDPHNAHTWDSPRDVREWLESIPMQTSGPNPLPMRDWMIGLKFFVVRLTVESGDPVPIDVEAGATL